MQVISQQTWYEKPFTSPHEAIDVNRYAVGQALRYMRRWFEEKQLRIPSIGVMPNVNSLVILHDGESLITTSRSSVASGLNSIWLTALARINALDLQPQADEMIDRMLLISRAPIEPEDERLLAVALECGNGNYWIQKAWDPAFTRSSFAKVRTIAALEQVFANGNWSLGTGFLYRDLAFINQVDGGDEWLVVRKDVGDFESWSAGFALKEDPSAVETFVMDCLKATGSELLRLEYRDARLRS